MKLPIVKHILVFTTWGQKCPQSEPEQFTFDNFQSNHPVVFTYLFTFAIRFRFSGLGQHHLESIAKKFNCISDIV